MRCLMNGKTPIEIRMLEFRSLENFQEHIFSKNALILMEEARTISELASFRRINFIFICKNFIYLVGYLFICFYHNNIDFNDTRVIFKIVCECWNFCNFNAKI